MIELIKLKKTTKKKTLLLEENKVIKHINSLLSRRDIVDFENDKVDALRLLVYHLENKKEMSLIKLVKFLKS